MGIIGWTFFWVGLTFALYIGIAIWSRVSTTAGFYVAGQGVPTVANGMAVAADWMSAASFISMAGLVAFLGSDGSVYLMGWTGGYVLLALLLAPFLRKFGKFTVPDFVGTRYYSNVARVVAAIVTLFISFTYVAGQMRGVGVVFGRYLEPVLQPISQVVGLEVITLGVIAGMFVVATYAVLGGMKGITYTQVAQYCVLIFAYTLPAVAIAFLLAGNPIPHIAIGDVLPRLDGLSEEFLGTNYSDPFQNFSMLNVFCITVALMVGTAGLPHVIVRFYTVKKVRDARWSAFWALLFIAILYTIAPAVGMFAKYYILSSFSDLGAMGMLAEEEWVRNWAQAGLIQTEAWTDGMSAEAMLSTIDRDIIVLATPEIAGLSAILVGIVAAGGMAAALSTASGLLLVISSSVAHDIYAEIINPDAPDERRLFAGRVTIVVAVFLAGLLGIYPLGFVAEVVAFAFGLAAAAFFPVIVLGIFWKRCTKEGAIAGMIVGLTFTFSLIMLMRAHVVLPFIFETPILESFLGVNAQGIGTVGMILAFVTIYIVSKMTDPPPQEVQDLVEQIRYPRVITADELAEASQVSPGQAEAGGA
jgi:cation/acetate symporter